MTTKHQEIVKKLLALIEGYPVEDVLEAGLTVWANLASNMLEARLVTERQLMLVFTDAMTQALEEADQFKFAVRLQHQEETIQ